MRVSVYGKNLTNEVYFRRLSFAAPTLSFGTLNDPREYGIEFSMKFKGAETSRPAAPAPAPVVAAPPPVVAPPPPAPPADSDGDGVIDTADRGPNTPAGAKVDASGCELDGDRDGVVDRLDKCPNTPAGDKVDAVGCSLTMNLEVKFETNSANIKPESYGVLDEFADFLKAVPSARGDLEGHTDSAGADAYNQALSQKRADAVKAYVVGKGVDAARLKAIGYGESRPVADNKTAEGRAQNRRVLFTRAAQ
jgi:OOP family OmpA-OmpF porin